MNQVHQKKQLEKKLMKRGMLKTIEGQIIEPPDRLYDKLGEEVLWILNEATIKLSCDDFSKYLCKDYKIMNKVLRKLTTSNVGLVEKKKIYGKYYYTANFQKNLNIPTIYKLVRMESTKSIR